MSVKMLLTGLLVLGTAAFQVFADQKCFAPVVCNQEDGPNSQWTQLQVANASETAALREEISLLQEREKKTKVAIAIQHSEILNLVRLTENLQEQLNNFRADEITRDGHLSNLQDRVNTAEQSQGILLSRIESVESDNMIQDGRMSNITTRISNVDIKANGNLYNMRLRLVNGDTPYEGRVEVYLEGEWGTVCDDRWGQEESDLVCRQLQLSNRAISWGEEDAAEYGQGSGRIMLSNVNCLDTAEVINDCLSLYFPDTCDHSEDIGVKCAE